MPLKGQPSGKYKENISRTLSQWYNIFLENVKNNWILGIKIKQLRPDPEHLKYFWIRI